MLNINLFFSINAYPIKLLDRYVNESDMHLCLEIFGLYKTIFIMLINLIW
jgi:hypothetical protein